MIFFMKDPLTCVSCLFPWKFFTLQCCTHGAWCHNGPSENELPTINNTVQNKHTAVPSDCILNDPL